MYQNNQKKAQIVNNIKQRQKFKNKRKYIKLHTYTHAEKQLKHEE